MISTKAKQLFMSIVITVALDCDREFALLGDQGAGQRKS
jgi:hypothetical protein